MLHNIPCISCIYKIFSKSMRGLGDAERRNLQSLAFVQNGQVGDRVAVPFILSCGNCRQCARNRSTICEVGHLQTDSLPFDLSKAIAGTAFVDLLRTQFG